MCDRGTCGKKFRRQAELEKHLNLHDNNLEKCYFCPWGVARGQTNAISTHFNQHFGNANFKCTHCDRTFYRQNSLDFHFGAFHEIVQGRYQCKLCDFKTHSRYNFSNHKRAHRNQKIGNEVL